MNLAEKKQLWDASKVYCPDFPRQGADSGVVQVPRVDRVSLVAGLERASNGGSSGFYSVYSFPWGHPKDQHVPRVDCIFIDFDVVGDHYDPKADAGNIDGWRKDMSSLLARTRMVASALIEHEAAAHFRAALSGHKGVHLYLDFPAIAPEEGEFRQFKNGLRAYGEDVIRWLDQLAGGISILPWMDVDASDLARLARHPNTRHHGAAYDDVDRWCVPVSIEELASIDVDEYLALTQAPRPMTPEMGRDPSERAGREVIQKIRAAPSSDVRSSSPGSTYDPRAVKHYEKQANGDIELSDLLDPIIMGNKPCIQAFREREDAYAYGEESRAMELSIMGRFISMGVPIEVMHEFFEVIPGYSKAYTQELIEDLICRGYKEFNCQQIAGTFGPDGDPQPGRAARFCIGDACGLYRRFDDIQLHDESKTAF